MPDPSTLPTTTDAHFRILAESVRDYAIFLLDPNGIVRSWSPGAQRLKGYAAPEIIGQHFSRFYRPEDVASGLCERELETALREGRVEDIGWRVRKDGSQFWANVVITALRDANGVHLGFGKVTRDLTDLGYRAFVEATNSIVWTTDARGRPNADSPSWRAFTGQTEEQWRGLHGWDVVHPDDLARLRVEWPRATAEGRVFESEFRMRRRDGEYIWMGARAVPFKHPNGSVREWFGATFDISARKGAEEREQAARRQAELANRAKDEFLAVVSHELRNPLSVILGRVQLLLRQKLAEDLRKQLATIERSARSQVRLIEDVLDVSRVMSGKLRLEPQPTDAGVAVKDAVSASRGLAAAKRIDVSVDLKPNLELVADPVRLQQIVANLVSNAVKFTPEGGKVFVEARREGPNLRITVRDTGEGIAPEMLEEIFEPFRQADASTTRRHGGLGLGLTIVRQLAQAHGGWARAESPGPGQGATLTVELPAAGGLPVIPPLPRARGEPTRELDGLRVLAVDDQEEGLAVVRELLESAGAEVETATSSTEALDKLQRFRAQVLVTDIGMPEMDGYALLASLRASPSPSWGRLPAVALTAYARTEDAQQASAAGFEAHVSKPVDAERLIATVARVARGA